VIPSDPVKQAAVVTGESLFSSIGCATCHVPKLVLKNHVYTEPNPYNPSGNLQQNQGVPNLAVDLTDTVNLPGPRLGTGAGGFVNVPAYTDLKVHDITTGLPGDPDHEALDMNQKPGSAGFFAGNNRFITRKLWGIANQHSFGHHGLRTTMRDEVLAHSGEALSSRMNFQALTGDQQNDVIEFLKSLQLLPANARCLEINDQGILP
jgi:CxxC motif-containing protein (DUF1111 family)